MVPPAEIGLQIRNGFQWGKLGQDFDYTVWMGNGPNYSEPVPGAAMNSPTAIASSQTNGKAFGGRFRVYPLPIDANLGRLEMGVSTYDGKWMDGNWLTSWGVDFAYLVGSLQARGEWVPSYRQMPSPFAATIAKGGTCSRATSSTIESSRRAGPNQQLYPSVGAAHALFGG